MSDGCWQNREIFFDVDSSIGYNSVHGVTTRILKSKLRGHAESLYLMARNATTRFEFVFTCMNPSHTKLFTTVIGIHRAFETTKLYRELKMRGALVNEEEKLRILPLENQSDRIEGVWNLSSDQGNLGVLLITNIRVVWYATMNPLYNVSIPYLQLRSCRVRDSKFGAALVIETSVQSGEYILGFRVDPEERLDSVCKAIQSFHAAYLAAPIFRRPPSRSRTTSRSKDKQMRVDAFAAYFSDSGGHTDHRPIVFSDELGVAIEQLKSGYTLGDLWKIDLD
ncbi:Bardet-Biedl syndrome 5-like protein [Aphelenchoides fujianensis]|nr:Bardet-Biedl syndrome 5-like protein [Aphelenchoides fujianensis]